MSDEEERFVRVSVLFSEPKIPQVRIAARSAPLPLFQCSSASRKFLNVEELALGLANVGFQCSSASRKFLNSNAPSIGRAGCAVSVLFSEPKIPQLRNYSHC